MESQKNPENKELAQKVEQMSRKLNELVKDTKIKTKIIDGKRKVVIQIENEQFVMKQIKPGVTIFVPLNTTSTADILAS